MPNPFNYGPLVKDPTMFFGRDTELNTLRARLRTMQSTSIVGLRRIGKSSLLYQLARTLPDELGQSYVPLYINLQDARYRTVAGFTKTVAEDLNERMGGILSVSGVTDMSGFARMMERLSGSGIRPVLCLDEFEEFAQHGGEFNDDFLEALRALGGQAKLAMVTTARTALVDLIRAGRLTSPFYNIFSQIDLGLLDLDAARALRHEPFEREGIILSPEDEALVEGLGGRHPCFLQMACYHLYDALHLSQTTRADVVLKRFDQDAEPHFGQLWDNLSTDEKAALKMIAGEAARTDETELVLKRLERLGMVEERADGNWQPFSTAFARRMKQYPVRSEAPEVSVAEEDQRLTRDDERPLSLTRKLLLFVGVAVAVLIVAALISSLLPDQKLRSTLIVAALILLFALVGVGELTGHDFLEFLGRFLGLGGS